MLAVKEIGRITFIEGKGCKAGKWAKLCGSPFPPIAKQILDAERARARGMRVDWRRVPTFEVKVSSRVIGRRIAPRILALHTLRRSVCGSMPLRSGGKFLASPARECGSFCIDHIHRPRRRQRDDSEHRPIFPLRIRV